MKQLGAGAYVFMVFIFAPFMDLLENKMPPNVALVLCFALGIPAVIDCLTAGIILVCGKAPKSFGGLISLGTKRGRRPLLWFVFY